MDFTQILALTFLFVFISVTILLTKSKRKLKFPPPPAISFSVIGHLHLLKLPLKHVGYNATHLFAASYGDHWRNLRRFTTVEIFSNHKLNSFLYIRKDEIRRLISRLSQDSLDEFVEVEMKSLLTNLASNNIIRMLAGKRYYAENSVEAKLLRQLVSEVVTSAGARNPADYLLILRWLTTFEKRIKDLGKRFDTFLQRLVDEKREEMEKGETVIDHLLALQNLQPDYYTDMRYTIVEELAEFGARIHVCDISETLLNQKLSEWEKKGFQVTGSVGDVTSRLEREKVMQTYVEQKTLTNFSTKGLLHSRINILRSV